jgi:hypothetical protein
VWNEYVHDSTFFMKLILVVAIAAMLMLSCKRKKVPDKVYCQGFVVKVIETTPEGEELLRQFTLGCNGMCPGEKACEKLKREFNPPRPDGLVKEEWCGCPGDTIPAACDIVIRTFNNNGRQVQQADCTPWDTCPVGDSCIQQPDRDRRIDTVKSVTGKDSIYRYTSTLSCECE